MSQPQPPQGLKGGVIFFSLRQRPGHGICRPTLVSCSCSTVRPKAGASLGREGNTGACTHTSLPPLTRPACAMPPVACPAPMSPPCTPKTQNFGTRTPIPRSSTYSSRMHLSCQACCHHLWAPLPGQGGARRRGCLEGNWDPCD